MILDRPFALAVGEPPDAELRFSSAYPRAGVGPARPLEPVLDSRLADSSGPATVAHEHGNRADRANDECRKAEHRDDYAQGIGDGALQ